MRPFIPDYIPAVGEIDPFVKVPRPDNKPDQLGLAVLDEPAAQQSDPTVFTLQLRAVTKSSAAQPMLVRSIEDATKDPKQISGWINSINDLHRHKPPPSVRCERRPCPRPPPTAPDRPSPPASSERCGPVARQTRGLCPTSRR